VDYYVQVNIIISEYGDSAYVFSSIKGQIRAILPDKIITEKQLITLRNCDEANILERQLQIKIAFTKKLIANELLELTDTTELRFFQSHYLGAKRTKYAEV
jgi:hypothetical protein